MEMKKNAMNKNTIIIVAAMGILFLFAVAQAVQLTGIKNQLEENELTIGSASVGIATTGTSSSSGSSSGSTSVSSLNDLPGMVGGC